MRIGETIDSLVKESNLESPEPVAQLVAKVNPKGTTETQEAIWALNGQPRSIYRVMTATHPEKSEMMLQKYREAPDSLAVEMMLREIDSEHYENIKQLTEIVLTKKALHITVQQLKSMLDYCNDLTGDLEVVACCLLHEQKEILFLTEKSLIQIQPTTLNLHLLQDLDRVELAIEGPSSRLRINQHKSPQHPALFQWYWSGSSTPDSLSFSKFASELIKALHKR